MAARIYSTDEPVHIGEKIYKMFDVHDLCIVTGLWDSKVKGELVLKEIRRLDILDNVKPDSSGAKIRRSKKVPDSIGGPLAQKIFRYKIEGDAKLEPDKVKYTIWRLQ